MSPILIFGILCFLVVIALCGYIGGVQVHRHIAAKKAQVQAKLEGPKKAQAEAQAAKEKARTHGRTEMLRNWAWWAAGPNCPPDAVAVTDTDAINKLIDSAPPMTATVEQLRFNLWQLSKATPGAKRLNRDNELLNRYWSIAARIHYMTEGEGFDAARGISNADYLSHDDPGIREAYIAGGHDAMEKIRVLVATARDRVRQYDASVASVNDLARNHQAGLEALFRETGRGDKRADDQWEAEAKALGGLDELTP